jgi:hypothetical protein
MSDFFSPGKFRMRAMRTTVLIGAAIFATSFVQAQGPGSQDVERAQFLRSQADFQFNGEVSPQGEQEGYAAESPNDPDLGEQRILKHKEQYQPFTFSFGTPFFYTSNIALVRAGEQSDFIVAPALALFYQPRITKTLYLELSLQQQWFFYDEFTGFNFASFDAIAGVVYYLPQVHNLTLRARYDYNRLTGTDTFNDFYSDHSLVLNAELPFRFGRAQQLSFGLDMRILLDSNPDPPGRDDYEVFVGYSANLSRSFSLTGVGRLAVRDYREGGRTDVSEILALNASYRPREWLILSAVTTFAWNQSNQSVFDYHVANVGAGVSVTLKF